MYVLFARLRVVEQEDHGLVIHPGLHEAALQVLVPFCRPVVLRDLDLSSNKPRKNEEYKAILKKCGYGS